MNMSTCLCGLCMMHTTRQARTATYRMYSKTTPNSNLRFLYMSVNIHVVRPTVHGRCLTALIPTDVRPAKKVPLPAYTTGRETVCFTKRLKLAIAWFIHLPLSLHSKRLLLPFRPTAPPSSSKNPLLRHWCPARQTARSIHSRQGNPLHRMSPV